MRTRMLSALHLLLAFIVTALPMSGEQSREEPDALSQATPVALHMPLPGDLTLFFQGEVAHPYRLTSAELSRLSTIRIRTREVTAGGEIMGAYIYQGIPVLFILEGIVPRITGDVPFDRPLDLVVSFISRKGKRSRFSYGELTMTDDNTPVTLAYQRDPLLPSKPLEEYTRNRYPEDIRGLRLICPGDRTDRRYLNDVVAVEFHRAEAANHLLPVQAKGKKCVSSGLWTIRDRQQDRVHLDNLPVITFTNWFRTGHGRGIKSRRPEAVSGHPLRALLLRLFPHSRAGDFFLFVACDGYRTLLSWEEIFETRDGARMLLVADRNSDGSIRDLQLACVADFFVDRNVWGLSHIQLIRF